MDTNPGTISFLDPCLTELNGYNYFFQAKLDHFYTGVGISQEEKMSQNNFIITDEVNKFIALFSPDDG